MEFSELVKKRRSIHFFTKEEVTNEDLTYILEAARWAPSAGNSQPWRFIIVRELENIHKIWETTTGIEVTLSATRTHSITPQNFIKKAPVVIVVCTDITTYKGKQSSRFSDLYSIQDSANATMNLLLAVADRGLGACWVGLFKQEQLQQVLHLPETIRPMAIIPIGHTKSNEKKRPRKSLEELLYYEIYHKTSDSNRKKNQTS